MISVEDFRWKLIAGSVFIVEDNIITTYYIEKDVLYFKRDDELFAARSSLDCLRLYDWYTHNQDCVMFTKDTSRRYSC